MVGYHRETHHFREEKSTKELTVPQHTRFILPLTSPDKIHRCAAWAVFFFYGHLSGRRPLHLANARPFGRLKAPLGLSLLRCAAQTRACLWQAEQAHHTPSKEKQSVPAGERPVIHIAVVCGFNRKFYKQCNSQQLVCDMQFTVVANESNRELRWQGASYSGTHPVFYYASSFSARSIRYPTPTWVWIRCGASGYRSNFLRRDAM